MEAEDKDEPKPKELEPGELEILDEDFDDLDIQAEDNWDSHNLPVDEDY